MARQVKIIDPVRDRIVEMIEDHMDDARSCLQKAQDLADLLNAADKTGENQIKIDGNVVLGIFNKSGGDV